MPNIDSTENQGLENPRKISFKTAAEARDYLQWRQLVDPAFRTGKIDKSAHPLLQDFFAASAELLKNPEAIVEVLKIDERVKKQLKKLQEVQLLDGQSVNVFDLMRNPDVGFDKKLSWYQAQIKPRLLWLAERAEKLSKEMELMPPDEQDTLDPSMDEMAEGKEGPSEGFYEVAPFYGGYYKGHIYEHWDGQNLRWQKVQKNKPHRCNGFDLIETTKRSMGGKFAVGKMQAVDLPYGFVIDCESIAKNEQYYATVFGMIDGLWYIKVEPKDGATPASEIELEFNIGKPKNKLPNLDNKPIESTEPAAQLPQEVLQKIQDAKSSPLDAISKARILCGFVRNHLEYSNESKYNDIYKQNPARYFEEMWQNKKADCDVANTFAAEVLRQAGIPVRMVAGHYVKAPTPAGTALLHGGTGHAWLEVYNPETSSWLRMDATPKGDPNMDEEEQEKDLDPEQNREGDYGEQEGETVSDEDLQKLIEKLEKEERAQEEARKTPEMRFAEEAGCSVEEARMILDKIRKLRELKDEKGNNVLGQSQKAWGEVLKKNTRERIVYSGPVSMQEGVDLVDTASAWIDVEAGSDNPTGFEKPDKRVETQKSFGGFEVYIAADMSGSMDEIDPVSGQKKSDAQRDSVFLFVDSVMSNAITAKRYAKKLKNPMPVRVCVSVFGQATEIVLPLTDEWGPKEQIQLYRALDKGVGGGTPDDEALTILDAQIQEAKKIEGAANMHRFVAVFADGGSNNAVQVRQNLKSMREDGNVVFGFGVTESGRVMEAVYAPDAKTIPNASKLAEVGIQKLVETIKKWYNI